MIRLAVRRFRCRSFSSARRRSFLLAAAICVRIESIGVLVKEVERDNGREQAACETTAIATHTFRLPALRLYGYFLRQYSMM